MNSIFDNGGFIGRTANYVATDNYGSSVSYTDAITSSTGGAPDFRWTLDGTTAETDGHTTTVSGTFSYTTGLISTISDQSADMGGSEYLVPANDSLINTGTGYTWTKRSVSFWFNADTTGSGTYPCIWEQGGTTTWMSIYFDSGLIYANVGEGGTSGGHATASISTGTTYHCLVTFDLTLGSNNIKIYLNGSLAGQATSTVGTSLNSHSGDIRIGSGSARNHLNNSITYASYDGRLQDVCYWYEDALTSTDASNIYNGGITPVGNRKNTGIWNLNAVRFSKIWSDPDIVNAPFDLSFDPSLAGTSDLYFKPDGLSFYITNNVSSLDEWNLSTPWVLSTATAGDSQSISGIIGVFFKPDGTRVFWVNNSLDTVNQADLSTPWDITTIGATTTGAPTVGTIVRGIRFSKDGTKMYAADRPNNLIEQFNLSTPWDISSPSASSTPDETLDVSTQSLNPYLHSFSPDGKKMWVTSLSYDNIVEYDLSTPWSVSSGTYSGKSLSIASQDTSPQGGAFKTNGSKLYIVGIDNRLIYQYSTR